MLKLAGITAPQSYLRAMEYTAGQIAALVKGEVVGDPDVKVSTFAKIEEGHLGALSFLENEKYLDHIYSTASSVILVKDDFNPQKELPSTVTLVKVAQPRMSLALLMNEYLRSLPKPQGISERATVDDSATIGKDVYMAPGVVVGQDARIGDGAILHANVSIGNGASVGAGTEVKPNCTIYHDCVIGADCLLHAGVVIGSDGFGFVPTPDGGYFKVPHVGNVILEDQVEIGANTCIDRGTMGSTIIRKGAKLDNLIHVAHNCEVGENCALAAQAGFAGSVKLGKRIMTGGQVGFNGHIEVADDVKIAAQSGILSTIKEKGLVVQGSPAYALRDYTRSYIHFKRLPDLAKDIHDLKKAQKEKES